MPEQLHVVILFTKIHQMIIYTNPILQVSIYSIDEYTTNQLFTITTSLSLLHLHFTSSLHALQAIDWVIQAGAQYHSQPSVKSCD